MTVKQITVKLRNEPNTSRVFRGSCFEVDYTETCAMIMRGDCIISIFPFSNVTSIDIAYEDWG